MPVRSHLAIELKTYHDQAEEGDGSHFSAYLQILSFTAKGKASVERMAILTQIHEDICVYCDESYRAVFAAGYGSKPLAKFEFPSKAHGWLTFAVDRDTRTVCACKGNNFQDPLSLIDFFEF